MDQGTATPTTAGAHPAVAARLVEDFDSLALLVDNADAETFATDPMWASLHRLLESLEAAQRHAELLRPTVVG